MTNGELVPVPVGAQVAMPAMMQEFARLVGQVAADYIREPSGGRLTVRDVVTRYLRQKQLEFESGLYVESSLERAQWYLASFCTLHGDQLVKDCKRSDVTNWVLLHSDRWQSSWTKTDALRCVVTCMRWAEEEELIGRCPYRAPRRPLWPPGQPRAAMTPEEFQAVMTRLRMQRDERYKRQSSRTAFRVALYFLWETGARTSEMRAVRWKHVDWSAGVIRLRQHKTAKAVGEERVIALRRGVVRLLRTIYRRRWAWTKQPSPEQHVFLNGWGRPWDKDQFERRFREYGDMAGVRLEVTAYSTRHGFTVQALENNVGTRQVADLLGHKTTRYVDHYGKSTRNRTDYLCRMAEQAGGRQPAASAAAEPAAAPAPVLTPRPKKIKRHKRHLQPSHLRAIDLAKLALERKPELKSDRETFEWLQAQPEYRDLLPEKFVSFQRALSYGRTYLDGPRGKSGPRPKKAG